MSVGNKILQAAAGNAGGPIDTYYIDGTYPALAGLAIDSSDNIYLGHSQNSDTTVTKIDDTPSVVWSKELTGGTNITNYTNYYGKFLSLGGDGKIHVAGRATFSGSGIGFYVRLTSAGAIDRSITTRQYTSDYGICVAQHNSTYVYLVGTHYLSGVEQNSIFTVRIDNSNGNRQETKLHGRNSYIADSPNAIAMDSNGNPFIAYSAGLGLIKLVGSNHGSSWYRYIGGKTSNFHGFSKDVKIDSGDNAIVVGYVYDSGTSKKQMFISKHNNSGTRQWAKQLAHSQGGQFHACAIDSSDNIYAYGAIDPGGSSSDANTGIIAKFSSSGSLTYQHTLDDADNLYPAVDGASVVVNSSDLPIIAAPGNSNKIYLFL